MTENPEVSICILTWNCGDTLALTLPRVSRELERVDGEILVFDQGSHDDTKAVVAACPHATLLEAPSNIGISRARNLLLARARGRYVLLLDGDVLPLRGSIRALHRYLAGHPELAMLGYDYRSCDRDIETPHEVVITAQDLAPVDPPMALTQFGMFRREVFDQLRFPEMPPFDGPGWGMEDDVVGELMERAGFAGAMIVGRIYRHQINSSWRYLEPDTRRRKRGLRAAAGIQLLLQPADELWSAVATDVLRPIRLPCRAYHWDAMENLGDRSFPFVFDTILPFLKFDPAAPHAVLLGGTVMQHPRRWFELEPGVRIDEITYLGTGVSAADDFYLPPVPHRVYPRGPVSQQILAQAGFNVRPPVGDTAFLLALEPPIAPNPEGPLLRVVDGFAPEHPAFHSMNGAAREVAVSSTPLTRSLPLFAGVEEYRALLAGCRAVLSAQIHPVIIALAAGIPARLLRKDLRFDDLEGILGIPLDVEPSIDHAALARERMQYLALDFLRATKYELEQVARR